jgi:hypothetical protein
MKNFIKKNFPIVIKLSQKKKIIGIALTFLVTDFRLKYFRDSEFFMVHAILVLAIMLTLSILYSVLATATAQLKFKILFFSDIA